MEERTKSVSISLKADGDIEARVGSIGEKDLDGDIFIAGSIGVQDILIGSWQHTSWRGVEPIGFGQVYEKDGGIYLKGKLFDTPGGQAAREILQKAISIIEWSLGFSIQRGQRSDRGYEILSVKAHEVSPVVRGAQPGTRTLSVKETAAAAADDGIEAITKKLKEDADAYFGRVRSETGS